MSSRVLLSTVVLVTACLVGCGQSNRGSANTNPDAEPTTACTTNADCEAGVCVDNACTRVECEDDLDCKPHPNTLCQFPHLDPWVVGTKGSCEPPCATDTECDFGQICDATTGHCRSPSACGSVDECPPGTVCNNGTCASPPSQCLSNFDCPKSWICFGNTCVDPTNAGGCATNADCDSVPACNTSLGCTCNDGTCEPNLCANDAQCDAGQYCTADGLCAPKISCDDHADCAPYDLVCDFSTSTCREAEECGSGDTCPPGFEPDTSKTPCVCLPQAPGSGCTTDDECLPEEYCSVLSSACEVGCRDDSGCAGGCGGATPCTCNGDHVCVNSSGGTLGVACNSTTECPGGAVCIYDVPANTLPCMITESTGFPPTVDCGKSCRLACDRILSEVSDPCPAGQQCGGDELFLDVIAQFFGSVLGASNENVSACYPAP